ncbi:hypothetical protein SAMN05421505_109177 [Sinosporangium album]|uniref:Uncharacterized protein n=1 Tax=Sinosporangium album TaxID=504805 RepID=A0A1G7YBB4_9ACTN|nr:hypothetical protein [Sinosporangium album]SDG93643.1 hypothetical protein SAMN05421505_109177 [Sinosporangium album]
MSTRTARTAEASSMYEDLVRDRIQTLRREAEEQRVIARVRAVNRARRDAERASMRLRNALQRLV